MAPYHSYHQLQGAARQPNLSHVQACGTPPVIEFITCHHDTCPGRINKDWHARRGREPYPELVAWPPSRPPHARGPRRPAPPPACACASAALSDGCTAGREPSRSLAAPARSVEQSVLTRGTCLDACALEVQTAKACEGKGESVVHNKRQAYGILSRPDLMMHGKGMRACR